MSREKGHLKPSSSVLVISLQRPRLPVPAEYAGWFEVQLLPLMLIVQIDNELSSVC